MFRSAASSARLLRAAALALTAALAACSSDDKKDTYVEAPVEQLYNQASDAMAAEKYVDAAKLFDEVERQHPYSTWAAKAQVMAAYAHYRRGKHDDAIATVERFIALHPGSKDAPYAYYLRGLCYYDRIVDVGRDQEMTKKAMETLEEVSRRFPDSPYARDARVKLDLTKDHLAGKEMEIGRYYLRQQQYVAAINRFRKVIEEYQTTAHAPEALHRLTEIYLAIGVPEEAKVSAAVLGHNFPGSDWYRDSYALLTGQKLEPKEDEGSWMSRAFRKVF